MRILNVLIVSALLLAVGCTDDTPKVHTSRQTEPTPPKLQLAKAKDMADAPENPKLEVFATFTGPMPTGVTVSKTGRVFVNFPRWGDPVEFTVAELKNGKAEPFPNLAYNKLNTDKPDKCLVSVQSVVVDDQDRLWIVDTGSINFQPVLPGGAKLVCVDLKTNQVVKEINFKDSPAVLPTTYTNDIRFDLKRGKAGLGFITDSSDKGPNGIIVVDLDSGQAFRRLHDHPSTHAEPDFAPTVEGEPLMSRPPNGPAAYIKIGSDGIAMSSDRKTLYYRPLMGQHLYSVSVDALADRTKGEDKVAATVKDLGNLGFASDGLYCETQPDLYLTDYEHNAIQRRTPDGRVQMFVQDPRMIWPDTLSIGPDNYLYFTANQLNRQKQFHQGKDLRQQPYALFRYPLSGGSQRAAQTTSGTR
jgi:sugar lactone lactonase YvrE